MRNYISEGVGTFALVFAGTGAVIVDGYSGGVVSHVGISLAFGLVIMAMVCTLGDISGAHINPAVTIGLWLAKRFPASQVGPYIASQCIGAIAASFLLRAMFGTAYGLGGTAPAGPVYQSVLMELVATAFLVLCVLCVTTGAKEKGITAALAIGGVVAFDVLVAGPVSGGSMNPARSIGPAVAGVEFGSLWIYIVAPCAGAVIAALLAGVLHPARVPAVTPAPVGLEAEKLEA